jgi:Glycosyl hydrolases family 16
VDPGSWTPRGRFTEDFDTGRLDRDVWLPHYLPAWSSRDATAARYEVRDSCLRLSVPPDHPLWCSPDHQPPLRVSGLQSGNHSGPVGSTAGQQPYRDGLPVREEQEPFAGWILGPGELEVRLWMTVSPRSMAALWLVGVEDRPERSAEICVVEVFGRDVVPGESAGIGVGLHPFRDPGASEDFAVVRRPLDVGEPHTYAVRWSAEEAQFLVDGETVRRCPRPPTYPMQIMVAAFDFPETAQSGDEVVPELIVDEISWGPWTG